MAASILLFGASLVVLWHIVSEIDVNELHSAFTAASLRQIGLAVLLTALSYSLLTCYDALALRQLKLQIPYRTTARLLHELRRELHARLPAADRGHRALLDLCAEGLSRRPGREPHGHRRDHLLARHGPRARLEPDQAGGRLASLIYTHIWLNQLMGLAAAALRRRLYDLGVAQAPRREDPGLAPGAAGLSPVARSDPDRRRRRLRRRRRPLRAAAGRAQHQLRDLPGGLHFRRHARRREPLRRAASASSRRPSCWRSRTIPASRCSVRCSCSASATISSPSCSRSRSSAPTRSATGSARPGAPSRTDERPRSEPGGDDDP